MPAGTATAGRSIAIAVMAILAVGAAGALGQEQPGARSLTPSINTGHALEDLQPANPQRRDINKRQHNPPDQIEVKRPVLSPPPPLTLDLAPIPYPDPRPPPLFNKDFPSLRFPREREGGRE
jgi:hypothetical protein